jgi:hypothetical protein
MSDSLVFASGFQPAHWEDVSVSWGYTTAQLCSSTPTCLHVSVSWGYTTAQLQ